MMKKALHKGDKKEIFIWPAKFNSTSMQMFAKNIRKFTGKSQHMTHSVQHGNINLFLLAPCNASCPRNGQTHVKNLAAFAARFLTFL